MAVRTMNVTDTYQNEPTAYMPTAFAPSDTNTAASIVHGAHRSPRRMRNAPTQRKRCQCRRDRRRAHAANEGSTTWSPQAHRPYRGSAYALRTARGPTSRRHRQAQSQSPPIEDDQTGTPHPVTVYRWRSSGDKVTASPQTCVRSNAQTVTSNGTTLRALRGSASRLRFAPAFMGSRSRAGARCARPTGPGYCRRGR